MDVRRSPGVVVVAPGIWARLDRDEPIAALPIGQAAPGARKVGVKRPGPAVPPVVIAACRVRLPHLDKRAPQGLPLGVQDAARDDDPLPDRLSSVLAGEISVVLTYDAFGPKLRTGDLGDRMRQVYERLGGMPERRGFVRRVV